MEEGNCVSRKAKRYVEFFSEDKCHICGRNISGKYHIDHIIPKAKGGESRACNLQLTCPKCNMEKADTLTEQSLSLIKAEERAKKTISQFFNNQKLWVSTNPYLREPQKEAYEALYLYFKEGGKEPALVVLPTACGKTGLAAICPYFIAKGRVLIIAPSLTIKDTIVDAIDPVSKENFYFKTHCLRSVDALPNVSALNSGKVNYEDCLRSHIIVANIQQLNNWIDFFNSDFFDLIIVDEAHHAPAASWQKVLNKFPKAKVIYITATPYRSDCKPLGAKLIYSYNLGKAIYRKYVKLPAFTEAVSEKIEFLANGNRKVLSLKEVLKLREEEWLSRSIALSEACNIHIIEKSLQILDKKRKGGYPHQIISQAMSIAHGENLVKLYRQKGVKSILVSSDMPLRERQKRIEQFEEGRYDVVVHIGILGEGYDHPPISIAAVFRPFRSFGPFAQLVGRTLRIISDGKSEDNMADIVTHAGLNLSPYWQYFADAKKRAKWLKEQEEKRKKRMYIKGSSHTERNIPTVVKITKDILSHYSMDIYPVQGKQEEKLVEKRIDIFREKHRHLLNLFVRKTAGEIINSLKVTDRDILVKWIGKGTEKNNFEVIIRLLNRRLNEMLKKDPHNSQRLNWTLAELEEALNYLPTTRRHVFKEVRQAIFKKQHGCREIQQGTEVKVFVE